MRFNTSVAEDVIIVALSRMYCDFFAKRARHIKKRKVCSGTCSCQGRLNVIQKSAPYTVRQEILHIHNTDAPLVVLISDITSDTRVDRQSSISRTLSGIDRKKTAQAIDTWNCALCPRRPCAHVHSNNTGSSYPSVNAAWNINRLLCFGICSQAPVTIRAKFRFPLISMQTENGGSVQ